MASGYKPAAPDAEFDKWYAEYPKKRARGDARKAWEQVAAIRPDVDVMIDALRKQVRSFDWLKDGGQYIPLPASYLRAERWDDVQEIVLPQPEKRPDRFDKANAEFEAKYGRTQLAAVK